MTPTKGPYHDYHDGIRNDPLHTPSRRRSVAGTPQKITTSVDHLLLPRVVGATVEGPKTPRRSVSRNNGSFSGFFPNASATQNSSNNINNNNNTNHSGSNGYALANGNNTHIDGYTHHSHGDNTLVASPFASQPHPESPTRYRGSGEQHTPTTSRFVDAAYGNGAAYNSNHFETPPVGQGFLADDDDDDESLVDYTANDRPHGSTRAQLSHHHSDSKGYEHHPDNHVHNHDALGDGYHSDGQDSLDIGSQEYDERLRESFYAGHGLEDAEDDDGSDIYMDEEEQRKQLEREAEELRREQTQLGFINYLTNFLRKQRDEYGWGGSPRKQQQQQALLALERERDEEASDSDFDGAHSSARVRRGSPRARIRKSRLNESHIAPPQLSRNRTKTPPPALALTGTPPPPLRRTTTPTTPHHHRASTPPALHRTTTPTTLLHRTATPPPPHRSSTPPPPPSLHRTTTPTALHYRAATPPALHRTSTPPVLHRTTTPTALRRTATPPVLHRTATPPVPYRTTTPPILHRTQTPPSLRRTPTPLVVQNTLLPASIVDWINEQSWIHAGVASGLLSPGTLIGVTVLCLAVGGRYMLGYDGSSTDSQWGTAGNCDNSTTPAKSQGVFLKGFVSDTWDKLAWGSSDQAHGGARQSNRAENGRRWLSSWIPHIPSVSHWIPSSRKGASMKEKIQIPTTDIQTLEDLEARIQWMQKVLVDLGEADEELSKEQDGWHHKLNRVSDEVDSLRAYVKDGRWIEQKVLELIRDEVPRHLVVSRDPKTGQLSLPGDFWETARGLFLTPEQMEKAMKDKLEKLGLDPAEQEQQGESSSGGSRWGWGASRTRSGKNGKNGGIFTWDDFLKENERAMSDFVEGRMSKVSRTVFLSLVRTEANTIWQGLERNVLALLEKQGKLQGKVAPSRFGYRGHNDQSGNNVHGRELSSVEQELILGLIDEALEKYSVDTMAKPDYALFSAGGRIIPRLTSPSYHPEISPTFWGRLGLQYIVPSPRREKPADKAIQPDMHSGECWAMEGQDGQLGIRLARKIVVSEVTIEHADPSVVLDMNSAPREVEVWGLRADEDRAPETSQTPPASASSDPQQETDNEQAESKAGSVDSSKPGVWWREGTPWPGATLLATVQYDASADTRPRQTFAIPLSKQTVPSIGIALRFKSNWGHANYTCVYRVRVHGHEVIES
ncbi:hypothetical protein BGZ99_008457 [Dissophora globulifera]|uniref:SUN domain-containing protein n=1 Tax=Dissophora globulifera TaxID=979702 RepID=A0A9P6R6X4_9FUNG|nr:hypothetical protein BGZ99_008457 [Dissophora globulifera]